jgi:hypothetical protein
MKAARPRRQKPLYFSLCVESREASIVDVKDIPMTRWHEVMDVLDKKGALPKPSMKRNILEMIERGL